MASPGTREKPAATPTNKASPKSKLKYVITNKRLAKLEAETKAWKREMEATFLQAKQQWKAERTDLYERISTLEETITSLRTREEGEVVETDKKAIKEEITKVITESLDKKIDAKKDGWVEIVKKNIKKEAKAEAHKEEVLMVHTTIEEEKMRQARRLNIRVTGILERDGFTPEIDGKAVSKKLGYKEDEPPPFTKAWRAGKDITRKRALILQFPSEEARSTFIRKRMILRGLEGSPIYLDDDLTQMQVAHRRACMPKVYQARKEGKKATYRDGRVIIDGRTVT